jgi:hypothetical protein
MDTPLPEFGFCSGYHYDDLSPIASGGGPALACQDDNYISMDDPCYGAVAWSPDTFVFEESHPYSGASYYIPSTCVLQEKEESWDLNNYVCEGGSIVRGVKKDGKCLWDGSTLLCNDCTPKYAPLACNSLLGEHPDAPKKDNVVVPGNTPALPPQSPSFSSPTPASPLTTENASSAVEVHCVPCRALMGAVLIAGTVSGLMF